LDPRNDLNRKAYRWTWELLEPEERTDLMHPNHISNFFQTWEFLVDRAREAATEYSRSYRRFSVGCSILAYRTGLFEKTGLWAPWYKVFTGANIKLDPGSAGANIHAEEIAIGAAIQEDYDLIVALVLAGETQEDHVSGLTMPTLHPCGRCRALLEMLPEVKPDTIIMSVGLEGEECEILTFEEVLIRHSHCCEK